MLNKYLNIDKSIIEAGCDEAGRGSLSGPVVAACVVFHKNIEIKGLDDSKKISANKRYLLRNEIERLAVDFAIAFVSESEILKHNILNASIKAMHLSLDCLKITPSFILIDGNRFKPYKNISHRCIVKGDSKFSSIAAASILAKTYRDEYMNMLHKKNPKYMWNKNKGYPTYEHINCINKFGISIHHRKNFRLNIQPKLL